MMSETVHYKGKLTPILVCKKGMENKAKELYGNRPLPDYYDSYLEWLTEDDSYYIDQLTGALYSVTREQFDAYDDIMNAVKNNDSSISFEVKYYNGACCLEEALDKSISLMISK